MSGDVTKEIVYVLDTGKRVPVKFYTVVDDRLSYSNTYSSRTFADILPPGSNRLVDSDTIVTCCLEIKFTSGALAIAFLGKDSIPLETLPSDDIRLVLPRMFHYAHEALLRTNIRFLLNLQVHFPNNTAPDLDEYIRTIIDSFFQCKTKDLMNYRTDVVNGHRLYILENTARV